MADTLSAIFLDQARRHGARPALRVLAAGGAARDETLSWAEWAEQARAFAAALVRGGHQPGQAVAILAGNRTAWPIVDLGVLLAGGLSVGVYPTSAPEQVRRILADSGATVVVVDTAEQLAKVRAVRDALPALRTVIAPDAGPGVEAWDEWMATGRAAEGGHAGQQVDARVAAARGDDAAVLIYTSGSTGEPRGAVLAHRYLLASAGSIRDTLGLHEDDTALSFLPFCHAAERVFGLHTRIVVGMEAALVEDADRVFEAARAYGPTLFGGLPRFYEKAAEQLRAAQTAATNGERLRWERTLVLGAERSRLRRAGREVPAELEEEWREVGGPVLARAAEVFGGRMRLATSGGATLPTDVAEYLDALGISILGGYGLTEHLCAAFHRPHRYAFDSAGPPMPGTGVRIAGDGEILLRRGGLTFSGYHGRPRDTAAAFTPDGAWLRTGDLGTVDGGGCLRVTGRKKELIALSNGKKVAPLPIESALALQPWIDQAMLYGEGRRFLSALLVVRRSAVEAWARDHGHDPDDPAVLHDPRLRAAVEASVERVNQGLSNPERVRRWVLLGRGFTIEGDELTPTLKLRRTAIAQKHRAALEALYHES